MPLDLNSTDLLGQRVYTTTRKYIFLFKHSQREFFGANLQDADLTGAILDKEADAAD